MSTRTELPDDVMAAIRANRKIEAIKLLREHRRMALKEAKNIVDTYAKEDAPAREDPSSGSGLGRIVAMALAITVGYAVYRSLT
jgi:hypothetical protein